MRAEVYWGFHRVIFFERRKENTNHPRLLVWLLPNGNPFSPLTYSVFFFPRLLWKANYIASRLMQHSTSSLYIELESAHLRQSKTLSTNLFNNYPTRGHHLNGKRRPSRRTCSFWVHRESSQSILGHIESRINLGG